MSPANRPGGRSKRTVSGGGNAYRRGSGLGSGSVGNGPRGASGGSFTGGSGGNRGVGGGGLLAVLLALLIGGASNNNANGGNRRGCLGRIFLLALIVVGAVLLLNLCSGNTGGDLLGNLLGGYTTSDAADAADTNASGSLSDALGSLLGNYGSTSGQIAPASVQKKSTRRMSRTARLLQLRAKNIPIPRPREPLP